jgi:hypothetical protein
MQKWITQAQKKPHVSSIDFPINHPGMKAIMQPRIPDGTP